MVQDVSISEYPYLSHGSMGYIFVSVKRTEIKQNTVQLLLLCTQARHLQ
jgi:hypothetical protein